MLADKRSAGVTPEVNPSESLCFYQARIRLPTLALKPRGDITRSPKRGCARFAETLVSTRFFGVCAQ